MKQVLTNSMTNTVASGGFGGSASSPVAGFDPILISLVRRSLPNLIAYDICGVQPMTGPTGLIFAMRSRYATQGGTEAFYNEANSGFSGAAHKLHCHCNLIHLLLVMYLQTQYSLTCQAQ
jgi:hypothetical protein